MPTLTDIETAAINRAIHDAAANGEILGADDFAVIEGVALRKFNPANRAAMLDLL